MDQSMSSVNDSLIPTEPIIITTKIPAVKPMEFFFPDSDQFKLEFDCYQALSHPYNYDSVVPAQVTENGFDFDFKTPNIKSYNNSYTSLSLSVSSSSMDVGIVPDQGSSLSYDSYPFARNTNSILDISGNIHGSPLVGMDREARVLRYKEKRKNRKFEKTIRYASRKAYAETRPRIKGRFVKRTDLESDIDRYFIPDSSNFVPDVMYGIVPSL